MLENSSPTMEIIRKAPHHRLSRRYTSALLGLSFLILFGLFFLFKSVGWHNVHSSVWESASALQQASQQLLEETIHLKHTVSNPNFDHTTSKLPQRISSWERRYEEFLLSSPSETKELFEVEFLFRLSELQDVLDSSQLSKNCFSETKLSTECSDTVRLFASRIESPLSLLTFALSSKISILQLSIANQYEDALFYQIIFLSAVLALLLVKGVFIFRPALQDLKESFDTVSAARIRTGQDAALLRKTNLALDEALLEAKASAEKTAEYERELQKGKRMQSLGRLAGGIAHDFNNILFAILGYSQMALLKAERNTRIYDNLEEILRAANRAKVLVDQILVFSQWKEKEALPISLEEVVDGVIGIFAPTLPHGITIETKVADEVPMVLADLGQMYQLLSNLVKNSIQAMEEEGGAISIELFHGGVSASLSSEEEVASVGIRVTDTGTGMSAEVMDQMFEPFFTTKGVGDGTGIGLSAVHGIIEEHEGRIDVKSRVGEGTSITVRIPVADTKQVLLLGSTDDIDVFRGEGRILLIDDEPSVLGAMSQMLDELGYFVDAFEDPIEALRKLERNPGHWDLVITDQQMPKMKGLELAEKVVNMFPNLPVMLCTGFSDDISPHDALQRGCRRCLIKPVSLSSLAVAVDDAINGSPHLPLGGAELVS